MTHYKETNIETNTYPSVPTGHLPAGGEIHADEENTEPEPGNVEPSMSVQDDPAREVLDALDLMRSRLGLPVERPNGRDVSKAGGLVAKVASANDGDTGRALAWILAVIGWMPSNTFWLRRVTNGRSLASNWSQIANDYAVDQLETQRRHDAEARDRDKPDTGRTRKATPVPPGLHAPCRRIRPCRPDPRIEITGPRRRHPTRHRQPPHGPDRHVGLPRLHDGTPQPRHPRTDGRPIRRELISVSSAERIRPVQATVPASVQPDWSTPSTRPRETRCSTDTTGSTPRS